MKITVVAKDRKIGLGFKTIAYTHWTGINVTGIRPIVEMDIDLLLDYIKNPIRHIKELFEILKEMFEFEDSITTNDKFDFLDYVISNMIKLWLDYSIKTKYYREFWNEMGTINLSDFEYIIKNKKEV